jgi:UBX domain-containing protein 1
VNTDHTIRHLFNYCEVISPVTGSFNLVAGFPPKPLTDLSLTLEQAKLLKSSIMQKQA